MSKRFACRSPTLVWRHEQGRGHEGFASQAPGVGGFEILANHTRRGTLDIALFLDPPAWAGHLA